jgi:hypothetical protein
MPAGERIAVQSVTSRKAGHDPRPLAASTTTNIARSALLCPQRSSSRSAGWGAGLVLLLFISAVARYLS